MSNNTDIDSSWKNLLQLSNAMMEHANDENWQVVSELAIERHQSLVSHFELFPVGPQTAEYYYTKLNDFMSNEQSLQSIATKARKKMMKDGAQRQQGKRAAAAYKNSAKIMQA